MSLAAPAPAAVARGVAKQAPHADAVAGWIFVAPDERVEEAHVRAVTLQGRSLTVEPGFSGSFGTFNVWTKKLPPRFVVEATDGRVNGLPFKGTLRAIVQTYGPERLTYVNPATTLAAQYALDHPKVPYSEVVRRVKAKLGLAPWMTLGEDVRRSAGRFDGAAFLTEAAREGGLDAFVRKLAADIDAHPNTPHPFPATRHFDESSPLSSIGVSVGSGIAKAGLGYLLSGIGLSNVSNALGLTSSVPGQLAQLQSTLDTITTALTTISGQLSQLTSGIGSLEAAVAKTEYAGLDAAAVKQLDYFVAVTDLGSASDPILTDSGYVAEDASEIANILDKYLPAAASPDPIAWCAANQNTPSPAGGNDGTRLYTDMCQKIEHDIGTGGPPAGADPLTWCGQQKNLVKTANMAGWSCAILGYAAQLPHPGTTSGNASESAYTDVAGADQADGLLIAYDKMKYAQDVLNQPFLTFDNYSVLQDEIASTWESRVALLGSYTSIYDAAEPPNAPPPCPAAPNDTLAQCDVDTATQRTTVDIPALQLQDIPEGFIADTRTNYLWVNLPGNCSDLPSPYLHAVVQDFTCQYNLGGGGPFVNPTISDLQSLISGWSGWVGPDGKTKPANAYAGLSEDGGFPDLSSLASIQPPAGYGPNGWAGSDLTVLATASSCAAHEWDSWNSTGTLMDGLFCPALRLTDGVRVDECTQSLNNYGWSGYDPVPGDRYGGCDTPFDGNPSCQYGTTEPDCFNPTDQPTTYDWTIAPYNDHVDYFHPVLAFAYDPLGLNAGYWTS